MYSLLTALFRLPLWVLLLMAAGLGWAGYEMRQDLLQEAAEKTQLLARPQKAVEPVSAFDPTPDGRDVVEANITARWAAEYNTRLYTTKTTGRDEEDGTRLSLLDETAEAEDARQVAAVIVVRPKDHDRLTDWMIEHVQDWGIPHPLVHIDGLVASATETSHVDSVLKKHGLTRGPNFFYLDPFLDGREAGLTPDPHAADTGPWVPWGLGLALVALAGARYALRNRRAPALPVAKPVQLAEPATQPKPARPAKSARFGLWQRTIIVGAAVAFLFWSGWAAIVTPLAVVFFAIYGFRVAVRKITEGAVRGLDRLTGVSEPRVAPAPLLAPARSAGAAYESPIVSTPGLGQRVVRLLRNRRFAQWLPFLGVVAVIAISGFVSNGTDGVKNNFTAIFAPLNETGKMVSTSPPAEAAATAADGLQTESPDASFPQEAYNHSMRMFGLTVLLVFVVAYGARWLNRRYGLALDDPWERLDQRLQAERQHKTDRNA